MQELASGGTYGSDEQMFVYLYPNKSGDDNECENAMKNALVHMGDQLLSHDAITYYEISINYDHPNLSASDKDEFYKKFKSWCTDNNYDAYRGAHLGVTGQIANGKSRQGYYSGNSSFARWNPAVMGTGYGVKEYYKNGAIHEALHSFISQRLSSVSDMIEDEEHDLGQIYSDGSTSPMCTSYENKHSTHGNCSTGNWFAQTYSEQLTWCTKNAVTYTADDET